MTRTARTARRGKGRRVAVAVVMAVTAAAALVSPAPAVSKIAAPPLPTELELAEGYHDSFAGLDPIPGPRSGTAGGAAVHEWFGRQLGRAGLEVHRQAFGFDRFVVDRAALDVVVGDGSTFRPFAFPLYYRGATAPAGVTATLVDVGRGTAVDFQGKDVAGRIAVAHSPVVSNARAQTLEQASTNALAAGAAALVVSIEAPGNLVPPPNTPVQPELGPLPTLLVGKVDGARLAALDGATATFVLDARVVPGATRLVRPRDRQPVGGIAYNTFATVRGLDDDVVIVGTPLNGWFDVASERSSGVAVLLEVARRFATAAVPPQHTMLFVGLGGHEVEAGGLTRFLACQPLDRVVAYVHMGATVAGRAYQEVGDTVVDLGVQEPSRTLYLSENPVLQEQALAAFGAQPAVQVLKPGPGGVANPGEQADAYALGLPIAAISGANLYFHTQGDLPSTLSQDLLEPMSDAYAALLRSLAATPLATIRSANAFADSRAAAAEPATCPTAIS